MNQGKGNGVSALIVGGAIWIAASTTGWSQAAPRVLYDLPIAPSGFSKASSIYAAPRTKPEQGFNLTANLAGTYDSNVTQGSGGSGRSEEKDFILSPGLSGTYVTEGDRLLLGGSVSASYDEYFNVSDFSGLNYDLSAFAGYSGAKVIAVYTSGIVHDRGVNRFYGDYIEQTRFNNQVLARYRISPKTSLVGLLSHSLTAVDQDNYNDTNAVNAGLAGLWSATPLLDLGPGLRYTLRTAEGQPDFSTFGPNFNLNYQLTTKVSLRSTAGVSFVDRDGDSDGSVANWSLLLNYQASELWGFTFLMFRDTQANPNDDGGLDEISNYQIGYFRKIRRATFRAGVSYETRTQDRGETTAPAQDFDYFTINTSLTMPVFAERANVTLSLNYRDLSSDDSEQGWDGIQTGVGMSWKF